MVRRFLNLARFPLTALAGCVERPFERMVDIDPVGEADSGLLRFDRLDNFWFVLMHELAHLCLHQDSGVSEFYDDLEFEDSDPREEEADALAGEVLIPEEVWKRSAASRLRTEEAARHLAKELRVHPSIVAGRMRHHFNSYRILNRLVGQGEVRPCFDWE